MIGDLFSISKTLNRKKTRYMRVKRMKLDWKHTEIEMYRLDFQRENNGYWTNGRFDLIQKKMPKYERLYKKKDGY